MSGGASALDDDSLEMVVSKCQQTQRERNPAALTIDDATYLQAYLNICEGLIDCLLKDTEASEKLRELNKKYEGADLGPNIKKTEVTGLHLCAPSGWVPSQVCW